MRTFLLTTVLAFSAASLLAEEAKEINWTPRFISVQAEGAMLQRVFFTDGQSRYGISLDTETTVAAANGGTKMTFEKVPSAIFTIGNAAKKLVLPPEPKAIEDYRRAALAYAQQGATEFTNLQEEIDSLAINGWRSYRLTFSHNFFGQRRRCCVTFLTFPNGQQSVLVTSADEGAFAQAMARSEYLIRSWHLLPATGTEAPKS